MTKRIPLLLVALITAVLLSCKKQNNTPSVTIVGRWQVLSDSTYKTTITSGGLTTGTMYIGKAGDYYEFNANGHINLSGDGNNGTATYALTNNQMHLTYDMPPGSHAAFEGNATVSDFTAHTVTIRETDLTGNGYVGYILKLVRD
jgi:hypothetical protein